jgi:signal transduction histidine kinase
MAGMVAQKVGKYQTEERLRSNIARDLHDEMGSTLTSINILSKVAMDESRSAEEVLMYLQKIKDHSSNMMESMSDIVWAINPTNDSLEKMILHMREFAAEMLEPAGIQFAMEVRGPVEKWVLNAEERKNLYLIFKEAINNAVKYSGASSLLIALQVSDRELVLRLADNGKGFLPGEVQQGNGLKNMQVRAVAMGAALRIESVPGAGTSIVVIKDLA